MTRDKIHSWPLLFLPIFVNSIVFVFRLFITFIFINIFHSTPVLPFVDWDGPDNLPRCLNYNLNLEIITLWLIRLSSPFPKEV